MLCCSHGVHHVTLADWHHLGLGGSSSNNVILINDAIITYTLHIKKE